MCTPSWKMERLKWPSWVSKVVSSSEYSFLWISGVKKCICTWLSIYAPFLEEGANASNGRPTTFSSPPSPLFPPSVLASFSNRSLLHIKRLTVRSPRTSRGSSVRRLTGTTGEKAARKTEVKIGKIIPGVKYSKWYHISWNDSAKICVGHLSARPTLTNDKGPTDIGNQWPVGCQRKRTDDRRRFWHYLHWCGEIGFMVNPCSPSDPNDKSVDYSYILLRFTDYWRKIRLLTRFFIILKVRIFSKTRVLQTESGDLNKWLSGCIEWLILGVKVQDDVRRGYNYTETQFFVLNQLSCFFSSVFVLRSRDSMQWRRSLFHGYWCGRKPEKLPSDTRIVVHSETVHLSLHH